MFVIAVALVAAAALTGCGASSNSSSASVHAEANLDQRENLKYEKEHEDERQQEMRQERRQEAKERKVVTARRRKAKIRREKVAHEEAASREEGSAGGKIEAQDTEKGACGGFPTSPHPFRAACEDSYSFCSGEAPGVVERAYHEEGEDFQEWAYKYSREMYSGGGEEFVENLVEEAAFGGCLAAMSAEYDRLYR